MALLITAVSGPASTPVDWLTDEAIRLARHGILEFVSIHEDDPYDIADPCPIASEDALRMLLEGHGYTPNVAGWLPNLEWELDNPTIECGPESADPDRPDPDAQHMAFVIAMELDSAALRFQDLVKKHGATVVARDVATIGGDIAVVCAQRDIGVCIADWHRDGLVISLELWGPANDIAQDPTVEMLASLVPQAVDSLAEASGEVAS